MADIHTSTVTPSESERTMCRERLLAYMIPNHPVNARQERLLEQCVDLQLEHEYSQAESGADSIPAGAKSFSIGHFSMSFDANAAMQFNTLTRATICPTVYAMLLREGLLYRGVERVI